MNIKDNRIIVTGGSGLIGQAILKDLRNRGAVAINFDIDNASATDEDYFKCDITNTKNIDKVLKLVIDEYGKIDGLVNNAYPRTKDWGTSFDEIPYLSWQKNVDMQLNSTFYLCQQVIKYMEANKSGSIVNITSIYGVVGNDWTIYEGTSIVSPAAYSAIKGGLINFTRYLSALYGEKGIRVNCVSPGGIFNHQPSSFVKAFEKKVPLKRMGKPEDIAPSVSFLLSKDASYITGHNLMVDGGWTAI